MCRDSDDSDEVELGTKNLDDEKPTEDPWDNDSDGKMHSNF